MNAANNPQQSSTPPSRGRSMRELFIYYLKQTRKHYEEAAEISEAYSNSKKYESETVAAIACSTDHRWSLAVAQQQFTERLANLYAQAAHLDAMNAMIVEQRQTNELLSKLCKDRHMD